MTSKELELLNEINTEVKLVSAELRGRGGLHDRIEALETRQAEMDKTYYIGIGIISAIGTASGFIGAAFKFWLSQK